MNAKTKDPSRRGRDLCCINVSGALSLSAVEQVKLFHQTGFDGFFAMWGEDLFALREEAERRSMLFQSVHAPFLRIDRLWGGDGSREATDEIVACVDGTAAVGVGIMVCHAHIGFDGPYPVTDEGIGNFRRIVDRAGERGVKIAFENTEGEERLFALMDVFAGEDHVGFCLDTGHEMCYNGGRDMLSLYGDRLFATHINDNLGVSSPDGVITWRDDLHLLPFDGIADWEKIALRLDAVGFTGPMTFELKKNASRGREGPEPYASLSDEEYVREAYVRARKFLGMRNAEFGIRN